MLDGARVHGTRQLLSDMIGEELSQIIDAIRAKPGPGSDYHVTLPEQYIVDQDVTDLMSYVARTSNLYGRIARLAGLAKSAVIIAENDYKQKFKSNLVGPNENERTRTATEASKDEHIALGNFEAISKLADSLEASSRISSESARKLLDKVQAMQIATHREAAGQLREQDFRSY